MNMELAYSVNDATRLINDVEVVVSTLFPDVDLLKLKTRLEEVVSNYDIIRKTEKDFEVDIQEKIDLYLSARQIEGYSKHTLDGYRIELGMFASWVDKPIVKIRTNDIRAYLGSNKEWSINTVDRKLSAIKTFFSWLVQEEMLLRNPASKIKPPKKPKRLPKGLTIEELEIVRESCEDLRERALIEVMYSTACRVSEIANLKISDVNIQEMSARIVGKGDKERIVYLSFKCLHHLRKYLKSRNDDCEYVFITERRPFRKMSTKTIQRIIDKIEQRANISKKLTPHVLRHTAGTHMMESGADLADVQHILGHENPDTTLVYAHVSEERKKQAHRKHHAL